jgi:hypothetical protein
MGFATFSSLFFFVPKESEGKCTKLYIENRCVYV